MRGTAPHVDLPTAPMSADASSIAQLAPRIRTGDVSSESLTRACLERIEADNPALNAFITVTAELAIAQARDADREIAAGTYRGLLHGVPISLKDIIDVAGLPTTAASHVREGHMARTDAVAAQRLRAAGAVIVGKTNLHEFAFGTTNEESAYGPARHPLDLSRSPGGSSGGSAVSVAAGMAFASIGTDTGGSIRIPSAACGLVGLKPSCGEVETTGVVPLSWTLDHVGPLCRSVTDAAILLDVLRGTSPKPEATPKPSAITLGVPRGYLLDRLDTEVAAAFAATCERLRDAGVVLRDVAIPHAADAGTLYLHIVLAEAAAYHGPTLDAMPEAYHPGVRLRLEMARYVLAEDYARALRGRAVLTGEVDAALEGLDGLLLPSLAIPAPKLGTTAVRIGESDEPIRNAMLRLTQLFNITGHPALTIPCGATAEGLPIGAQIVGQRDRTGALLQVGRSVESAIWVDGFAVATR